MNVRSIGICGYGHFGRFLKELVERFVPTIEVRVHSRRFAPDNETFFSLEDTASADVVILCGAISEYEAQLCEAVPHMRPDTVVVDVATVKKYTSDLFRKYDGKRTWISCHPMFGPESYAKQNEDVSGFRIVLTDHTLHENDLHELREFLAKIGFVVIEMSADEHDQLLAETLFLTHYIGQTMQKGGFGRTIIDTVSFASLMNAVEAVAHDAQLFWDVYTHNPYCKEIAARFHAAQETVFKELDTGHDT